MPNIIVCTGHRKIVSPDHVPLIRASVRVAIRQADEMVFGGAMGFDFIAIWEAMLWKAFAANPECAEYAKTHYPKTAACKITVVVCKTRRDQPRECVQAFEDFEKTQPGVINYVELGMPYIGENLMRRNVAMVDRIPSPADGAVIAYWDRHTYKSGTYQCMRYAGETRKISVTNVCPEVEENKEEPADPSKPDSHPF